MSGLRPALAGCVLLVALAGCGGSDESGEGGTLVIVSDVDNPPPEDEGFLEGLVRLELYAIDLDGGKPVRLTENEGIELGPDCSPDGRRIAFASSAEPAGVAVMNVDGTGRRHIASGFHPSWSPDGREIVVAREADSGSDLFVVSADGEEERLLLAGPGSDRWPAWSPAGDRIAFLRAPDPDDPYHDLYVMNLEGTETRRLLQDVDGDGLTWSPDSRELAFTRTVEGSARIWVIDVETGRVRKLTHEGQYENPQGQPTWSPNGMIAFAETAGIAVVRSDGSGYRQLPLEPSLFPTEGEVGDWVTWSDPTWCG